LFTKAAARFVRGVTWASIKLGKAATWLVWSLLIVLTQEVISRYALSNPHGWSIEILSYHLGGIIFLSAAYALVRDSHVRMDALWSRWSEKKRAMADAATFACAAAYLGTLLWKGVFYTRNAIIFYERYNSAAATPVGPIKVVIMVGTAMLLLQAVAFLIRDIYTIRGKTLE
jgi:TRAP-type mannitol/chloroaromatic compound transport system permease small subunit